MCSGVLVPGETVGVQPRHVKTVHERRSRGFRFIIQTLRRTREAGGKGGKKKNREKLEMEQHPEYVKLRRSRDVFAECIVQNARITSEITPA